MKRWGMLLAFFLTGCSTHPLVDVLDYFKPGTLGPNDVQPYGGVCIPQGAVLPPAAPPIVFPGPPPGTAPPPAPTFPGVVPPPAPLPGAPGTIPAPIPVPTR